MVTWARVAALGLVFAAGWGGAMLVPQRPARADTRVEPPEPAAPPAAMACTDPSAMEANANLVTQVHDYKARLALAESRRDEAEGKVGQLAAAAQLRHVASIDEWARMSREGTLRLKMPCSSWDGIGNFSTRRAKRGTMSRSGGNRRFERAQRAEMAGLSSEERDALPDVYRRAHARTWAAMRSVCEANADFRKAMTEVEEPTDESRVETCRNQLLDVHEATARTAMARVTELRAARGTVDRATSDVKRVTFALTDAPHTLDEEMVRALGREKATRAADNGVICFDETIYQVRAPDADG